jgi:hypothetical protein
MPVNSLSVDSVNPIYGFDPRTVGSCVIWLDAADSSSISLSSGTNISQWSDKSGYSNHAQVRTGTCTLTANAKNNLSGVTFGGSAILSNASTILSMSTHSFFLVAKETTHVDYAGFVSFLPSIPNARNASPQSNDTNTFVLASGKQTGDARGSEFLGYYGGYNSTYQVVDLNSNNSSTKTIPDYIYSGIFTGESAHLWRNSFFLGSSVRRNAYGIPYQNNTGYLLGGRFQNGTISTGAILNGVIYEFLYYNSVLNTDQRQMVEGYLAWKWGFQTITTKSLPIQHSAYINPILGRNFVPTDIDQCCVWFDAADATTITSNATQDITAWRSKGWSTFSVTTNSGKLSTGVVFVNGLNTVRVNGNSDLIVTNFGLLSNQPRTYFTVFYSPNPGASDYYSLFSVQNQGITLSNGQQMFIGYGTKNAVCVSLNFGGPVANNLFNSEFVKNVTTGPMLCTVVHSDLDSNQNYVGWNGIQGPILYNYLARSFSTAAATYYLGNRYNNLYNLCELIEYNQVLTIPQRQQVEGYLARKWGIDLSYTGSWPAPPATTITSPLDLVGGSITCRLWLDASDTTRTAPATGGNITGWTDKSASATVVSFASTQNIRYDPTNKEVVTTGNLGTHIVAALDTRDSATANLNVFICGRWNTLQNQNLGMPPYNAGQEILWANGNNRGQYLYYNDVNIQYLPLSASGGSNIWPFTSNKNFVYSCHNALNSAGATSYIYCNQVLYNTFTSGAPGAAVTTSTWFGDYNGTGLGNTAYAFKEIIIYFGALTATQIQQVHYYLGQKYALTRTQYQSNNSFALYPPISGQAFSPVTIPSLVAWYDAADPFFNSNVLPTENSTITNWFDKSGWARNMRAFTGGLATITYATRSTYPSIYINNSTATNPGLFSTTTSTISLDLSQYTHFNVCTSVQAYNNQPVFSAIPSPLSNNYNSLNGFGFYIDSDAGSQRNRFYGSVIGNTVTNGNATLGDAYPRAIASYTMTQNGQLNSFINGAVGATDSDAITRNFGAQGFGIGCDWTGLTPVTAITCQTSIHELLVYNTVLTIPERQRVEGYLAWKWGLNSKLPSTHPYFDVAPTPENVNYLPAFSSISTLVDTATYIPAATTMTSFYTGNTWNVPNQATISSPTVGNNYFSLNGTNQYLVDSAGQQNTGAYTIDCWFYARGVQTANIVGELGQVTPGGYNWSQINVFNNGGLGQIYMTTYTLALPGTFMGNYFPNQWYHVCMTSSSGSGTTTTLRGYVNGIFRGSGTGTRQDPRALGYAASYFIIGGPANPNNNYFNGHIGPYRFYRRVLTDSEIYANYKSQAARFGIQI